MTQLYLQLLHFLFPTEKGFEIVPYWIVPEQPIRGRVRIINFKTLLMRIHDNNIGFSIDIDIDLNFSIELFRVKYKQKTLILFVKLF